MRAFNYMVTRAYRGAFAEFLFADISRPSKPRRKRDYKYSQRYVSLSHEYLNTASPFTPERLFRSYFNLHRANERKPL